MGDAAQQKSSIDSRSSALLNRLANRRNSGGGSSLHAGAKAGGGGSSGVLASSAAGGGVSGGGMVSQRDVSVKQRPTSAAPRSQTLLLPQSSTAGQRAPSAGLLGGGGNAMGVQGRLFSFQTGGGSGRFSDRPSTAGASGSMNGMTGVKLASEAAAAAAAAASASASAIVTTSNIHQPHHAQLHDGEVEVAGSIIGGAGGGAGGDGGGGEKIGVSTTAAAGGVYPYVISRSQEEKFANPDRLVLDRRKLTQCPYLEGEDKLRLLNYQNNFITRIENLGNLPNLIFLDLYNNQVKKMDNLEQVPTLRVIMLGKNLVETISGIHTLTRLDVLDLHGNQISEIKPFGHLPQLRVLNLAGNQLTRVENLDGMPMLTELNVRRNRISEIQSLEGFTCLERLFLSSNSLSSIESLSPVFASKSLVELALDGNPVASEANYRQSVIERAKTLRHLDLRRVTEEERRLAQLQAKKEEEKREVAHRKEVQAEERQEGIKRVRQEFDQAMKQQDYKALSKGVVDVTGVGGVDMHMHFYGTSLDHLDRQMHGLVSVCFEYVLWHQLAPMISALTFAPGLTTLQFSNNGIQSIVQLNFLGRVPSVPIVAIEANEVCSSRLMRPYVIFRMGSSIKKVNGKDVAASEILHANALFAPVTSMIARNIAAAKMSGTERLAACAVEHEYHTHATIANIPSMSTHARATTKPDGSALSSADVIVGGWVDEGCAVNEAIEGIHTAWAEVLHHYIDSTLSEIDDLNGQGRQHRA